MPVVKAYHAVKFVADVRRIVGEKEILPVVLRYPADVLHRACLNSLSFNVKMGELSKRAVRILSGLLEILVADTREFQRSAGRRPTSQRVATTLGCVDLLAGDGNLVFLSAWAWEMGYGTGRGENGLVFDALDLVRRGARVRLGDFINEYYDRIRVEVAKAPTDEDAAVRIVQGILDVQQNELSGDEAMLLLRRGGAVTPEVVWEGPLPVDWAIEIWESGVRLR